MAASSCFDPTKLPIEIASQLLTYPNTYDSFQVCAAFPQLECLTYDSALLKKVCLRAEFRFQHEHIPTYLLEVNRKMLIVSLDLSYNFWLSIDDLQKIIRRLPNLQHLYVFGTSLRWINEIFPCKLKTLGLTYCSGVCMPKTINSAYLHISSFADTQLAIKNVSQQENLLSVRFTNIRFNEDSTCERSTYIYNLKMNSRQLTMSFVNYDCSIITQLQPTILNSGWTIHNQSVTKLDKKAFAFKDPAVCSADVYDEIQFSKLLDNERANFIALQSNLKVRALRKLTVSWHHCVQLVGKTEGSIHLFKKLRLEQYHIAGSSILEMFVENHPLIQDLKITTGHKTQGRDSLGCIAQLKHLNRLVMISTPSFVNMAFLVDVGKACKNLTSLTLDLKANTHFVYLALCHMTSLKELVLRQYSIDIRRLLDSIGKTIKNITRISLFCDTITYISDVDKLLAKNRQLTFCCISVQNITIKSRNRLNQVLKKNKLVPSQYFTSTFQHIPEIHLDMHWRPNNFKFLLKNNL